MEHINQILNLEENQNEEVAKPLIVRKTEKKKSRKGFKSSHSDKTPEELLGMTQNRVILTFDEEAGYNFFLNDEDELFRLKKTSYLDTDFVRETGKYRVYLYYKNKYKTRLSYWNDKYQERVKKLVEIDSSRDINIEERVGNSLSNRIDEVHQKGKTQNDSSKRENSALDNRAENNLGYKKLKVSPKQKAKTKNELNMENLNLKVDLRTVLIDLEEERAKNNSLLTKISNMQEELTQSQQNVENLMKKQALFVSALQQMVGKLSPTIQSLFQERFAELQEPEVHPEPELDLMRSNTLNVDSESWTNQTLQALKEPKINPEHIQQHEHPEQQAIVVNNPNLEEMEMDMDASSHPLFHEEQTLNINKTPQIIRTMQDLQKSPWRNIKKGVLNIWQAIKLEFQRKTEEEIRQNRNTTGSWKPIIDPKYEHRNLFLDFVASDWIIEFSE